MGAAFQLNNRIALHSFAAAKFCHYGENEDRLHFSSICNIETIDLVFYETFNRIGILFF